MIDLADIVVKVPLAPFLLHEQHIGGRVNKLVGQLLDVRIKAVACIRVIVIRSIPNW